MPLQFCYFYADVDGTTKETTVHSLGSKEDLAALIVCAICKSKSFRDAFKLTQRLLVEEGINFEQSQLNKK